MNDSSFKFLGYRICKIHCEIKDSFYTSDDNIKYDFNVEPKFKYSKSDQRFSEVLLNVQAKCADFLFEIDMKGGFQAVGEMSDSSFVKFTEINGPTILFPFVRAIMASYTAQANIPALLLPTVNFLNMYNSKQEMQSKADQNSKSETAVIRPLKKS